MRNKQGEWLEHTFLNTDRDDILVILGHGLTGNQDRELYTSLCQLLADRGWPTLRFSYSGHGNSEGNFKEMTITKEVDDLQAILDQCKGTKKIAYIGHSMGAAVGTLTAAKDDRITLLASLAGMVHTKQFYDQEFSEQQPDHSLMWEKEECPLSQTFKSDLYSIQTVIPATKDVRLPWLFLHGSEDDVVLPHHSEDLFNAIRGKKKHIVYQGINHQFDGHYTTVANDLDQWLTQYLK